MERNRLATSRDEAKRLGLANLMQMHRTNMGSRAHRVRKSMARIKLVLNERRLALIQAQQDVRLAQTSEDAAEAAVEDGLLNAAAATLEAEAEVGAEAEQEGSLYEEEQPERVGSATQGGGKASSSTSGRL